MRFPAIATLAGVAAIAAGCGGDDGDATDGVGSAKVESEPQIGFTELRTCLKREKVSSVAKGGLSGKGISGSIPLLAVGGDLQTATELLVLDSADAAKKFIDDPPPAASFIDPETRKGNVIKARPAQPQGQQSAPPASDDAAIDRCVANP